MIPIYTSWYVEIDENKSVTASVVSKTKSIEKKEERKFVPFLRPLDTPPAIAAAGFLRCNCHQGMLYLILACTLTLTYL